MGLRPPSLPCPAPPCQGTGVYGQGGVWAGHCRIYEAGGEQSAAPSAHKWTACDRDLAPHGATMDARAVLVGLVLAMLPTPGLGAPVESDNLQSPRNKLLLVSFDGFRWDYDQDVDTPNLDTMVREGVKARHMTPPFVTLTSPCHFTLVTGEGIWHSGVPDGGPGHRRGQAREGCRDCKVSAVLGQAQAAGGALHAASPGSEPRTPHAQDISLSTARCGPQSSPIPQNQNQISASAWRPVSNWSQERPHWVPPLHWPCSPQPLHLLCTPTHQTSRSGQ